MRFNLFNTLQPTLVEKTSSSPSSDHSSAREPLRSPAPRSPRIQRQVTIEADPDSLDSVISNPQSYPITIVPNRPASFYGYPTNGGKSFSRQASTRSRNFRPGSMRKVRRRAVFKNGDCNVLQKNLMRRRLRFMQDLYTTLVDSQWRWTLLVFALSFILSWLFFALLWWLIMYTHGDLEELHLPEHQEESGWTPCVSAIHGFTSCFLFSIETQHTIGYGVRTTSEECPEAIFMMCFQSIFGVMSSAFMGGIVFAKMTRAKQRAQTLLFSKYAVICQRDGGLSLMFRVGDMRKSHIIGAAVRAKLIRTRTTKEGEVMSQHFTELEIGADESGSDLFFIWPMVIEHKIDESSPFYNMSATDILQDKFELVVVLEGTVESTGQSTQARSSYVNTEILWGHRFDPVVLYNKDRQAYEIDYGRFNETTQVDTPLCSARELNEIYKIQEGFKTPVARNQLLRCSSYEPRTTRRMSNLLTADPMIFKHLSLPLPRKAKTKTATTTLATSKTAKLQQNKPTIITTSTPSLPASPVSNRSSGFSSIGSGDERLLQRYAALFMDVEMKRKGK